MLNRQKEDMRIAELLAVWAAKIKISSYSSYFDINKVSEGLVLKLLNLIYEYELVDLNHNSINYPGIDLGDQTIAGIAIQVTSQMDNKKIKHTLAMFNKYNLLSSYPNGLIIFVLSTEKINRKRKIEAPFNQFFSYQNGLMTINTLMRDISRIKDETKRSKILSLLEQQLGHTSYMQTALQDIMTKMSTIAEPNLRAIGHLLAERTQKRIKKFIALEEESWQHGYTRGGFAGEYIVKFRDLYNMEEDCSTKMIQLIASVQEGSALKVVFEEYLELEKFQFDMLAEIFFKGQYEILTSTGKSFQFILHSLLNVLIDKYNENLLILKKYFLVDLPEIENQYKTVNKVINFENINDKEDKLIELLNNLNESFGLYVFVDTKEKWIIESLKIKMMSLIFFSDQLNMDEINEILTGGLETVSFDGKVFAGFKNRFHIIFLSRVDCTTKKSLSILQQRSNIEIFYFEQY
ncbi:SMEK domain-containing protein [Brevibacillus sp. Leaf182]|uniref:SMEK domain-containing protein n=1 Tax=Brevibacillus sp. Leaf182 TaxID=1736290 RepID=UPI0006F875DC|nr:SMEK domain-containing protein [Brevibacillus sp. Leaf182]RAT96989.1 hypothetical protein ASG16_015000 [Brevibacillus sp. Leaf182]